MLTCRCSAPDVSESFALSHPNAFCVLDAGAKGAGLFATCDVSKGSYLFDYTGELLSQAEYNARYPSRVSDYTAALRAPGDGTMHFIDGRDEVLGSPSRFMNHNDQRPNVGRRSFFPTDGSPPRHPNVTACTPGGSTTLGTDSTMLSGRCATTTCWCWTCRTPPCPAGERCCTPVMYGCRVADGRCSTAWNSRCGGRSGSR